MPAWTNRTVLSGSSVNPNGTASHTCTFTAAASGNLLIAVVAGAVTSTTPSGWTLGQSAVANSGLYMFYKTATAGESSFTTTHNGSNRAIEGLVYEYGAGSSYLAGNTATGQGQGSTQLGPQVTGLTGTYTRFSARSWVAGSTVWTGDCVWTLPTVEDYDAYVVRQGTGEDGIFLTTAYDDGSSGASFNPSSVVTAFNVGSGEGIAFALSVVSTTAPSVTTFTTTAITATTATGNGSVDSDGGATITERGFCWSTSANPTTSDSKVTAAGTTGSYSASMTGLTNGTLYHVRAYAINSVGTSYGADATFRNSGARLSWLRA